MKKTTTSILSLLTLAGSAVSYGLEPQINEIRIDEPSTDNNEYVEIKGEPGFKLDGYWYLVLGDHSGSNISKGSGVVECAVDLTGETIPENGFYLLSSANFALNLSTGGPLPDLRVTLIFENNDNVTHMLVKGYKGTEVLAQSEQEGEKGVDIDDNDDGSPNATLPWDSIVDAVGVVGQLNSGDYYYGEILGFTDVGPNGAFAPGHLFRNKYNTWQIGDFDIAVESGGIDTPGALNPSGYVLYNVNPNHGKVGSQVAINGQILDTTTSVTFNGIESSFTVVSAEEIIATVPAGASNGFIEINGPDGQGKTLLEFTIASDKDTDLFYENFEAGSLGQAKQFSFTSEKNWLYAGDLQNSYASMNGFDTTGKTGPSDDWLIVGPVDLTNVSKAFLKFLTARNFGGPALQFKISSDYSGLGSPSSALWTNFSAIQSVGNYVWTSSDAVNLGNYLGKSIYIAFQYTSSGDGSGLAPDFRVDEIWVYGEKTAPVSIFAGYELAFNTWRVTGAGFLYDAMYPFVYSANLASWWYIFDNANNGTDSSYFFYDFKTEHFSYTSSSFYPVYVEYDGTPGGNVKMFP